MKAPILKTKELLLRASSYAATVIRLAALASLIALFYYIVSDDVLITEDNRKTAAICIEEVEKGCPLVLEALSESNQHVEILKARVIDLEARAQVRPPLQSFESSTSTDGGL